MSKYEQVTKWIKHVMTYSKANGIPYTPHELGNCLVAYYGLVNHLDNEELATSISRIVLLEAQQTAPVDLFWKWVECELVFETLVSSCDDREQALRILLECRNKITDQVLDLHNQRKRRFATSTQL